MNGWEVFVKFIHMRVGNGRRVKFWEHVWCGNASLRMLFHVSIVWLATRKHPFLITLVWDIRLQREVLYREVEDLMALISRVYGIQGIGGGGMRNVGIFLNQ